VTCENQAFFFPPTRKYLSTRASIFGFFPFFFFPSPKTTDFFFCALDGGFFPPSHIFSVFFHFTSPISLLLNRFLKKFLERYKEEENYQLLTFDTNQVGKSPAEKMKNMSHFFLNDGSQ